MKKKFQILIPHNGDRGGMESLHQLAYGLKKHKQNVEIVYSLDWRNFFTGKVNKVPKAMKKYCSGIKIKDKLNDNQNCIIFVPEIFTSYVRNIKYAQVNLFWLSVNNYWIGYKKFREHYKLLFRGKYGIGRFIHLHFAPPMTLDEIKLKQFNHIAQSRYAESFIKSYFGKQPISIFDYTDDIPKYNSNFFNLKKRQNLIAYNPVKGIEITKRLKSKFSKKFKFVPIENMSHQGVRKFLQKVAIYIDFGEHPGRDRFPREALLCGCCIITGYRGSAAFEDVPIDNKFKLYEGKELEKRFGNVIDFLSKRQDCKKLYEQPYNNVRKDKTIVMSQIRSYLQNI